jgi:hypothetical protein
LTLPDAANPVEVGTPVGDQPRLRGVDQHVSNIDRTTRGHGEAYGFRASRTVELIAETSAEILRLREEIKLARKTLDRSQKRLSRREASVHLAAGQGKAL